jgi:hypothetical protein
MDRYLERAKKLRAKLKEGAIFDHMGWLKIMFDMNGNGVVKVWCGECKKDVRGWQQESHQSTIDNVFNNFKRLHILNTTHIWNCCVAKKVDFDDHPQFETNNGRPITLSPNDHKRLINEGVETLEGVNVALANRH